MRRTTLMLSTAAALMFAGLPAASATVPAPPAPAVQDAKIDVNIDTDNDGAWYVQPVWLAIGGLAVLVIIFIAVSAARGKNTTTVVK